MRKVPDEKGDGQERGATDMMDRVIRNYTKWSMYSLIVTADRGYGRDDFIYCLPPNLPSSILVMTQQLS